MLYTQYNIPTVKQAFRWLLKFKDEQKINLNKTTVFQRNNYKEVDLKTTNFDKFYRDFSDGINQIAIDCTYQNHPIKMVLIIDNLHNRVFIEAENAEIEKKFVKEYIY